MRLVYKIFILLIIGSICVNFLISMTTKLLTSIATAYVTTNPTTYTFKRVGDLELELDVYLPSSSPPSSGYPIVFAMHGGGNAFFSKNGLCAQEEIDEILERGWVLVSVGYRLVPGVFLKDILQDVHDAYAWVHTELVKEVEINLDALIIFGPSAGGGLAVLSGYKLQPRPKAIIAFYPFCTNWTDSYAYIPDTPVDPTLAEAANKLSKPVLISYSPSGESDPKYRLWFDSLAAGKMGWLMVTHDPNMPVDKILDQLRDLSASENIDDNYPPTYLSHGLNDSLVPYSQSVQLAEKLKEKKIEYVLELVPNAGHGFDQDWSSYKQYVLPAFDFAEKHISVR